MSDWGLSKVREFTFGAIATSLIQTNKRCGAFAVAIKLTRKETASFILSK